MKDFSFKDRWQSIRKMKDKEFDLLIIGGGINGAGIARDAASRGMSVALIEARDFASGTSSRSSKLIHGGIRYLENYEFHLVFEALSERAKLFEIAPHLVHPLRFLIPIFNDSRVGMGLMGLGMWLYDALALFETPQPHERLSASEVLNRIPIIRSDRLTGAYEYSDAYMDDDRLVIETLRSANHMGATIANYVQASGVGTLTGGRPSAITAKDTESGESFQIRAQHIVSTVGPWTDELGGSLFKDWKKVLRPTKGIHIVLDRQKFPISRGVVMGAESRIVFVIPRHEMLIIGTTDTDFNSSPLDVVATSDEVKYLLDVFHSYFPGARVTPNDILSSYAGVRPLVNDGASTEGKTSREHSIWSDEHNLTYVAGGKYTTYRLIAEQAVEHVLKYFSFEDQVRFARSKSTEALNPSVLPEHVYRSEIFAPEVMNQSALSMEAAQLLLQRHGGEAFELVRKFDPKFSYWQLEAAHAIMSAMCFHLEDFLMRRTPLFLSDPSHGLNVLDEVALVFQNFLGWSPAETENQKKRVHLRIEREMKWKSAHD